MVARLLTCRCVRKMHRKKSISESPHDSESAHVHRSYAVYPPVESRCLASGTGAYCLDWTRRGPNFMKVLVVDDHLLIREALREVLKELRSDAVILEGPDGGQAMQL